MREQPRARRPYALGQSCGDDRTRKRDLKWSGGRRRDLPVPDPMPSTTAIWRVMAAIVAMSRRPIVWPMSESRTV